MNSYYINYYYIILNLINLIYINYYLLYEAIGGSPGYHPWPGPPKSGPGGGRGGGWHEKKNLVDNIQDTSTLHQLEELGVQAQIPQDPCDSESPTKREKKIEQ